MFRFSGLATATQVQKRSAGHLPCTADHFMFVFWLTADIDIA